MSRLEELSKYLGHTFTDDNYEIALCEVIGIPREELKWLIEQVKQKDTLQAKVDELEKDKEFFRRNLVKAKADEVILRSENQRYKQVLEEVKSLTAKNQPSTYTIHHIVIDALKGVEDDS